MIMQAPSVSEDPQAIDIGLRQKKYRRSINGRQWMPLDVSRKFCENIAAGLRDSYVLIKQGLLKEPYPKGKQEAA